MSEMPCTKFLDYLDRSAALVLINPDETLLRSAKAMIRRQAEQGYSFVDCLSFCLTSERKIAAALAALGAVSYKIGDPDASGAASSFPQSEWA
jgi:hypothetical protein